MFAFKVCKYVIVYASIRHTMACLRIQKHFVNKILGKQANSHAAAQQYTSEKSVW